MNKMLRILEKVWLVIGSIGLIMAIYSFFNSARDKSVYLLMITLVSAVMFYVRRKQRIRFEEQEKEEKL